MDIHLDRRVWAVSAVTAALVYAGIGLAVEGTVDAVSFLAFIVTFTAAWAVISELAARR